MYVLDLVYLSLLIREGKKYLTHILILFKRREIIEVKIGSRNNAYSLKKQF